MAKNLIPEICKMLGVELGEEFKIKGYTEQTYIFDDDGLKVIYSYLMKKTFANVMLGSLLAGKAEIVKLPWKPKKGERYWGFLYSQLNDAWLLCLYTWGNTPEDFSFYKAGWVFRTRAEAEDALPAVAKEMSVEYEL